jgi:hypothetical protein
VTKDFLTHKEEEEEERKGGSKERRNERMFPQFERINSGNDTKRDFCLFRLLTLLSPVIAVVVFLTLMLRIREVRGSNLGHETGYLLKKRRYINYKLQTTLILRLLTIIYLFHIIYFLLLGILLFRLRFLLFIVIFLQLPLTSFLPITNVYFKGVVSA